MTIYQRIKKKRQELGLTQEELAFRSGYTSRSTINKIEAGLIDLTESKITAISKALEVNEAFLMGWKENEDSNCLNSDFALIAQEVYQRPDLRTLFNAVSKLSPEDLRYVIDLVKRLERENNSLSEDSQEEV